MNKLDYLYSISGNNVLVYDKILEIKVHKGLDISILEKFLKNYKGLLNKKPIIKNCSINNMYFLYPYTIGYGYPKTNISQLLEIAKLGEKKYCQLIYEQVLQENIPSIIQNYDAVAFVPPSIKRACNILNLIKKQIRGLGKPIIHTYTKAIGPQIKTIKNIEDKIRYANHKFDVGKVDKKYKNILIIDDVVNTGASLCSIANKINQKAKRKDIKIDSFCLIGSRNNTMIKDI